MNFVILLLLTVNALCNASVLRALHPRIIDGEDVKPGEIPYQVSLQLKHKFYHFCGGSVLNENYVITAAHCVDNELISDTKIVAGTVDLNQPNIERNIEKIIIHEQYNMLDSWRNDIALIKVSEPFVVSEQLSFVSLPSPSDAVNVNDIAVISGWGDTKFPHPEPTTTKLQRANIYIADQAHCRRVYGPYNNVYDTNICAHDTEHERGTCRGDSGGPVTVKGKLTGLISWGAGCGSTDHPNVFTRVSSYIDWIHKNAV